MNTEETKEAIKVMQAFVDGDDIQYFSCCGEWLRVIEPLWDFHLTKYRIKPESKVIWIDEYCQR